MSRQNYIVEIDRDSYFTQYAWALENFDLRGVFEDFLETEAGIDDDSVKNKLWEDYKKSNEDGVITKLQVDVLNYVMKYEKGVYKKGQTVAEVYDGKGKIHLLEPGYYFIEVKGASGLAMRGKTSGNNDNQLFNGNKFSNPDHLVSSQNTVRFYNKKPEAIDDYDCCFYVDDELDWIFEVKEGEDWKYTYGFMEANQNFIFLYQIGVTEISSLKREESELSFKTKPEDYKFVLFDFCEWNSDPLSNDFGSFKFIVNKVIMKEKSFWKYGTSSFLCGMDADAQKTTLDKLRDNDVSDESHYYYKKILKNIELKSGKLFTYHEALDDIPESGAPKYDSFNKNHLHGGDGGYVSAIIYIDKATSYDYSIGDPERGIGTVGEESYIKDPENYGIKEDSYTTWMMSDDGRKQLFCAEMGAHSDENNQYISVNGLGLTEEQLATVAPNFIETASQDFKKKCDYHLAEQFDYDTWKAGAGHGLIKMGDEILHICMGGGELGEGLRLNEFFNSYYQHREKGSIKIKYLCSRYARKFKADFTFSGEGVQPLFYIGDYIPIGESFNLKVATNGLTGGFGTIEGKSEALINRRREVNYLSFDLDTTKFENKEEARFNFLNYSPTRVYFDLQEDREHFSYKEGFPLKNEIFDPLVGCEPEDRHDFEFTMDDSISFLNYLLYAYNSAASGGLTVKISSFNSTTYDLILSINSYKNFKFLNVFEEIIQLSFEYKNKIPLNDYYDVFSQRTLNGTTGCIKSLEYSLVDPNLDGVVFTPYVEGYKFLVPKYTKLYIRVNFNTSRVNLDTDLSSFFGSLNYYKKNIDFDHSIVLDSYFSEGSDENFQCIEFIPNTSQDIQIYIRKYTFSFNLMADLYNNLFVNNLSGKTEFEVGEEVLLSVKLRNFERVSHLLNKAYKSYYNKNYNGKKPSVNNKDFITGYSFFESNHKFESFITFTEKELSKPYEYNIIDTNITTFFSRKGCHGIGDPIEKTSDDDKTNKVFRSKLANESDVEEIESVLDDTHHGKYTITHQYSKTDKDKDLNKGILVQSSRKIVGIDSNAGTRLYGSVYDKESVANESEFNKIALISDINTILEEDVFIAIAFKECDIEFRLSSNYNPGQKMIAVENGGTADISLFKPYNFLLMIAGGPTGNGEAGGDGGMATSGGNRGDAIFGGCGGDGYIGGNGGNGGSSSHWMFGEKYDQSTEGKNGRGDLVQKLLKVLKWFFVFPALWDFAIKMKPGAAGGYGGIGFRACGNAGNNGAAAFGPNHFDPSYVLGDAWVWWQYRTCLYCGVQYINNFSFLPKKDDFKKVNLSLKAGRQGLSLVKSEGACAGHGGGGGSISSIKCNDDAFFYCENMNQKSFYISQSGLPEYVSRGGWESLQQITDESKTGLFANGGLPGLVRGWRSQTNGYKYDGYIDYWSPSNMFPSSWFGRGGEGGNHGSWNWGYGNEPDDMTGYTLDLPGQGDLSYYGQAIHIPQLPRGVRDFNQSFREYARRYKSDLLTHSASASPYTRVTFAMNYTSNKGADPATDLYLEDPAKITEYFSSNWIGVYHQNVLNEPNEQVRPWGEHGAHFHGNSSDSISTGIVRLDTYDELRHSQYGNRHVFGYKNFSSKNDYQSLLEGCSEKITHKVKVIGTWNGN